MLITELEACCGKADHHHFQDCFQHDFVSIAEVRVLVEGLDDSFKGVLRGYAGD